MISLASLRTSVRQRADMENSEFVTDTELNAYINNSYKELYDIVTSKFEDYYSKQQSFTLSGSNVQALPSDFYKLRGIDMLLGGIDNFLVLKRWVFGERGKAVRQTSLAYNGMLQPEYKIMGGNIYMLPESFTYGDYRHWYIPLCVDMNDGTASSITFQDMTFTAVDIRTLGDDITIEFQPGGTAGSEVVNVIGRAIVVVLQDNISTALQVASAVNNSAAASALVTATYSNALTTQVFAGPYNLAGGVLPVDGDDFNGWSEYVVIDAAIKCLIKEESDVTVLLAEKAAIKKRIEDMAANRDSGEPECVTDVNRGWDYPWGFDEY